MNTLAFIITSDEKSNSKKFSSLWLTTKPSRKISIKKNDTRLLFEKFIPVFFTTYILIQLPSNMRSGSSPILGPIILICALLLSSFFFSSKSDSKHTEVLILSGS